MERIETDKISLKHPEDDPLLSTVRMVRDFERTDVWHDIKMIYEDREQIIKTMLADAKDLEDIRYLQGQLAEVMDFTRIIERLITMIEQENPEGVEYAK